MDFTPFRALTFDCYGTLIDWEAGILAALRPILDAHQVVATDRELLEAYAEFEAKTQREAYLPYRQVLQIVMQQFGRKCGVSFSREEIEALPNSVGFWSPFPDTVAALQALRRRFSLNVISNIDDAMFAQTAQALGDPFDQVLTAQQMQSYKPSHRNFEEALRRIGLPREQVLHVAQSLYHDIVPAKALGFSAVWVNRYGGKSGSGATLPATAQPDLEVPDLQTLAALVSGG